MPKVHLATLAVAVVAFIIALAIYHLLLGKK